MPWNANTPLFPQIAISLFPTGNVSWEAVSKGGRVPKGK